MSTFEEELKFSVLDDTILYIWKNAESINFKTINRIIGELMDVFRKKD